MKPKIIDSKLLFSGHFDLRQDTLENRHGNTHPYTSLILNTDSVSVLAETEEGKIICLREYRHPTRSTILGLPGGLLEAEEDPILGGVRELLEETGYASDEVEIMGHSHPFPGVCDQKIVYLHAKNAYKKAEPNLEPFEFIEVELFPKEELYKVAKTDSKVDGILCTALWYYLKS